MSVGLDTIIEKHPPVQCPQCGQYCDPKDKNCSQCGANLPAPVPPQFVTTGIHPPPRLLPMQSQGDTHFPPHATVVLQLLPSGECVTFAVDTVVTLGRGDTDSDNNPLVDLLPFHAYQHGVSRRHCQLERQGSQLWVFDLHSANGTYVNDRLLEREQKVQVASGDRLILGRLHITVYFSSAA